MIATDRGDEKYIVRVVDLRRWLEKISTGGRHWELELVESTEQAGECRSEIDVRFLNEIDVPNEITFRFPLASISPEGDFNDERRFVFLHPLLAGQVTEGLYFEGAKLKRDCFEDWLLFWPPLFDCVAANVARERCLGCLPAVPTPLLADFAGAMRRAEGEIDCLMRMRR